jgi:hypothetical protein
MIIVRNRDNSYSASGIGPARTIVAEGRTRPEAIKAYAQVHALQAIELWGTFESQVARENALAAHERNWHDLAVTLYPDVK